MTAFLIAALLLAPSVEDDALCDALKQIVAAAPGDYRAVAGEPEGKGGGSWLGRLTLDIDPGREAGCHVWPDGPGTRYVCMTNREMNAATDADVAVLANRTAACFAATVRTIEGREPKALGYPNERRIALPPIEVSIAAERWQDIVVMGRPTLRDTEYEPYISDKAGHSYWLIFEIRAIDPKLHGN